MSKTILQELKECPNNVLALRELMPRVNDYIDAIVGLYKIGVTDKEQTHKCIEDIEVLYNEIQLTTLN